MYSFTDGVHDKLGVNSNMFLIVYYHVIIFINEQQ